MNVPFVDLYAQHQELRTELDDAIGRAINSSAFVGGEAVARFERDFASYCGLVHAVGVSDGTHALILALQSVGVLPEDLVLTVSHTFIATVEAIVQCRAEPIFLEIDSSDYTLSPLALAAWLEANCRLDEGGVCRHLQSGRRVSAVIPVHLYGMSAEMGPILDIARRYNIKVVEDACQAHGAWYTFGDGRRVRAGSMGDAGCFSFYPGKNLGAMGEGGAVVTNNAATAAMVRLLRDHGQERKYVHRTRYGVNARLDAIQAGILDVKLSRLDGWNDNRRSIALYYREHLADVPNLQLPVEPENRYHVYHLFVVLVEERDHVQQQLQERGIATGLHYPIPLHRQQAFADYPAAQVSLPVTEHVASRLLSLPMYPHMTEGQAEYVVQALRQISR